MVGRFRGPAGARLLARRGSLAIRKFAGLLGGENVFKALAANLESEQDLAFASSMVQALNLILLTAPEVQPSEESSSGTLQPESGTLCDWYIAPCM